MRQKGVVYSVRYKSKMGEMKYIEQTVISYCIQEFEADSNRFSEKARLGEKDMSCSETFGEYKHQF